MAVATKAVAAGSAAAAVAVEATVAVAEEAKGLDAATGANSRTASRNQGFFDNEPRPKRRGFLFFFFFQSLDYLQFALGNLTGTSKGIHFAQVSI